MKDLFIFDINAIIHRCYHAVSELTTTSGLPVNAVYGTCSTFSRILQKFNPEYCLIAWDTPGKGERGKVYPEYKANRKEKDEDLKRQYPYVAKLVRAMGFHSFYADGWEADDVIATLVKRYKDDYRIYIVSGDKDLTVLVDDNVLMYDFGKDVTLGKAEVYDKFGVYPTQMTDYLSMVGDSSDNIPGIKGVGPKKAVELLGLYGSLDRVYLSTHHLKGKLRENIENLKDIAYMSRSLVLLRDELDLPEPSDLGGTGHDELKLFNFFAELDFRDPKDRFPGIFRISPDSPEQQIAF